jgi:hypothetical protein
VPFPLERIALKQELVDDYKALVPDLPPDQWRRVRGEQDIIVRYAPEQALATLPDLLAQHADRERLLTFFERVLADERMQDLRPTAGQRAMAKRIRNALGIASPRAGRRAAPRREVAAKRPVATLRKPAAAARKAAGKR